MVCHSHHGHHVSLPPTASEEPTERRCVTFALAQLPNSYGILLLWDIGRHWSAYKRGAQSRANFFLLCPYKQNGGKDQRCTRYTPIATNCVPMEGKELSTILTQHKAKAKHRTGPRMRATASWQLASNARSCNGCAR